ncbi:sigma-70 family RNA polymerase sigma factor [Flavobacterium sp.]|uniref:RNA polymerase sigma factor n=1 Tax=Flavobacterium sp. TaxID=239 RepID=UPI00286DC3AA|nr:sigma-70 family RNA polymerase sigma factor [Flavobacterium sp.]
MKEKIQYSHDDLVILIKNRDQKAFAYLYDNYTKALFGIIFSIVADVEESEDVLQKTFIKVWDNFETYNTSKGRLYTWMLNIARNMAIDYKRSKHNKNKIQNVDQNVYTLNNIRTDEDSMDTIGLRKIVDNLKNEHLILIELAYYKGYTQEEIGIELNIPLGTVKTRIRKALLILRGQLKEKTQAQ